MNMDFRAVEYMVHLKFAQSLEHYVRAILQPLAAQGDADAQYNLGVTYFNGTGALKDYAKALKWTCRFQWHTEARRRGVVAHHRDTRIQSLLFTESGLAGALEEEKRRVF